jgi:hypothetical protein
VLTEDGRQQAKHWPSCKHRQSLLEDASKEVITRGTGL